MFIRSNRVTISVIAVLVALACHPASAGPTTKPADADDYVVSRMRVQEFKAQPFAYLSVQTTIATIGENVKLLMPKLLETMKDGHIAPRGPATFVMKGATQDPNKSFEIQIGFPVAEGTKDAGDVRIRQLEAFRAATVLFSGAIKFHNEAYQQAFTEMFQAGLQHNGEIRETYLLWDGEESPNNVQMIQIGVK